CSAFRGTVRQLRAKLLPHKRPRPRPSPEDLMQPGFLLKGEGAVTPLAIPNGAKRLRFFSNRPARVRVDLIGVSKPSVNLKLGYDDGAQGLATGGAGPPRVPPHGRGGTPGCDAATARHAPPPPHV